MFWYSLHHTYNVINNLWSIYCGRSLGGWSEEGVSTLNQLETSSVTCSVRHLTSFAVLVDVTGQSPVSDLDSCACVYIQPFRAVYWHAIYIRYSHNDIHSIAVIITYTLNYVYPCTFPMQTDTTLAYRVVSYIGCAISLLCLIATIIFLVTLR